MERNDVASFFYYMWNSWDEQECEHAFKNSNCGWPHLWRKWQQYCEEHPTNEAVGVFFASLTDENQDLLVSRAVELYNRKAKIR